MGFEHPDGGFTVAGFVRFYGAPIFFGFVLLALLGSAALFLWSPTADEFELTPEELRLMERAARGEPLPEGRTLGTGAAPGGAYGGRTATVGGRAEEVESALAVMRVVSDPEGARVSVDGVTEGRTPLRIDGLRPRFYLVSVDTPGYLVSDTLVYLDPDEPTVIALALRPLPPPQEEVAAARPAESGSSDERAVRNGSLSISAEPAGAAVRVNGRRAGTAPLQMSVPPGRHTVQVSRSGYESTTVRVEVGPGERERVEVALAPQVGSLSVVVRPWGSIYVDGVLRARDTDVSVDLDLPVGQHRIRAEHPTLGSVERTVEIRAGESTSTTFDLN